MKTLVSERQGLGVRQLLREPSSLDQSEIQAIRSITAARKQKKAIELRGMRADVDLQAATQALQKVVDVRSQARSDLLQLEGQLETDEQDDQPIIELVVSDFGGPPPHKRLHRADGKKKHHHHHHHHEEDEADESSRKAKQEDQSDQDVESKSFDPDDLEAYTANAVNNNFNEVRRRGLAAPNGDKKTSVDLAASLGEVGRTAGSREASGSAESQEDNVANAFSEPAVN